jgi:hypothetical protein
MVQPFRLNMPAPCRNGASACTTFNDCEKWRRHPDSNWGIKVLQTSALPLGYAAVGKKIWAVLDSNQWPPLCQSGALPTAPTAHEKNHSNAKPTAR